MQTLLSWSVGLYFVFYVFEGIVRYALHLGGRDELIFLRDLLIFIPLIIIFIQQLMRHEVHPAFYVFFFVIFLHGAVMVLNMGSFYAVAYSSKMLMAMLAGAVAPPHVFNPPRKSLYFFLFLWISAVFGVFMDKWFLDYPWNGMETTIGGIQVDIGRDWEITGENERVGGFMRSSIHVAIITPLLAFILLFNYKSLFIKAIIAALTLATLYWTTQKGAILAYVLVFAALATLVTRSLLSLKVIVVLLLLLCIALPLVLPAYYMPQAEGVFSIASFNLRVEEMWPSAWDWIDRQELFPLGVGLGGIGGAQRLYAQGDVNFADNLFVFMYANFGIMAFVYLGWLALAVIRVEDDGTKTAVHAMATLVFLMTYGCVLSMVEDQMASVFFGATAAWLGYRTQQQKVYKRQALHESHQYTS